MYLKVNVTAIRQLSPELGIVDNIRPLSGTVFAYSGEKRSFFFRRPLPPLCVHYWVFNSWRFGRVFPWSIYGVTGYSTTTGENLIPVYIQHSESLIIIKLLMGWEYGPNRKSTFISTVWKFCGYIITKKICAE